MHANPTVGFWQDHGSYRVKCRDYPIPRFRCNTCQRTFSQQTFRHDYRDHRPEVNAELLGLLYSGMGLRQAGRRLGLAIQSVHAKFRKLAATCAALHQNLSRTLPPGCAYLLDEEESFEGLSIRPVTIPVLIERESWFVVATAVGRIRRLAPKGTRRRARQELEESQAGKRPDESRQVVQQVIHALFRRIGATPLTMDTDEKSSYRTLLEAQFGAHCQHLTTNSRAPRTPSNRLFPINVTMAMTRDNNARMRRRSWLVSKKAEYLAAQLHVFTVYRNYIRQRFNSDQRPLTAAMHLQLLERPLSDDEVVTWRQDWGAKSGAVTESHRAWYAQEVGP
jgi:hypothetical protein